ncbi:hypothetical protein GCM10022199_25420 [Marihabitans asiaticum]|uniref:Glycosyltransferase involved in cell wall biosynthesis n=1 Tax=Marihabitans asiaticum TaxID=415218 RepID=A0A560WD83_9MICO|nr:glycosyltransferase family 4 protein [Marihabitans asiaticum]TWD15435.1 glycosyltransferase involved in cell wall biosynthesis [Marihabitans asiaticum]
MSQQALRVAVVGPTHPYKGGVASHTTTLAHELAAAGHDVRLVSWTHLYPSLLYPGEQSVPGGGPDVEPFPGTEHRLSWARPDTLVRAGRELQGADVIVVVHVIPPVVPLHLLLLRAAGAGRTSSTGHGPRSVVIAHNVLPHEPHPGDSRLMRAFFRRVDAVIVHSADQARLARELDAAHVVVTDLPAHLPGGAPVRRERHEGPARLLALGLVRGYKGIDVLMRAMTNVPEVSLTVAGEMWGDAGTTIRELAADPRLRDRVEIHPGYVPAERIAELLARHDVLALTYRSATASQNVLLAHRHGLPVLASRVGTFADQVRDGVDGLLVPPGDEDAIEAALRTLADPGAVERLRAGVREPDLSGPWARYVGTLEAVADHGAVAVPQPGEGVTTSPSSLGRRAARAVKDLGRASVRRRVPVLELTPRDFPDWVRPTDVLAADEQATRARDLARRLDLPGRPDPVAAWAALGALETLVAVHGDRRRSATVLDLSGPGSPFARWARTLGYAPVEVEHAGSRSSIDVVDLDTASLDVIVALHPGGADGSDLDEIVTQASWALRSRGVLSLTVAVGGDHADSVSPADLRAVLARSDNAGLALVGDLDGDITEQIRHAADATAADRESSDAYAVVRLTLRRR